MESSKKWYQSKTVWVNALLGLIAAIDGATSALRDTVNPHTVDLILGVTAAANLWLRSITTKPITKN